MSICLDIWTLKNRRPPSPRWRSRRGSRPSASWSPRIRKACRRARSPQFCKVPHNTMSTHLAALMRGGLIAVARQGRSMNYRADLDGFRGLIDFMLRDCCGGRPEICAPVVDDFNAACCAPAQTGRRHEALHVRALLALLPRADDGRAQANAFAGNRRARRRQRHHGRPRRQTPDSNSGERRRQAHARKHGHGQIHRRPRAAGSGRSATSRDRRIGPIRSSRKPRR